MARHTTMVGKSVLPFEALSPGSWKASVITFLDLTMQALVICKDNRLNNPFISQQVPYKFWQILLYMCCGEKKNGRQFSGNLPWPEERKGEFSCARTKSTLRPNHHSWTVIRQRMKFCNVYLFDFFIFSATSAQSTYQFSSLNAREAKPVLCREL